jgi:hypothetical protein
MLQVLWFDRRERALAMIAAFHRFNLITLAFDGESLERPSCRVAKPFRGEAPLNQSVNEVDNGLGIYVSYFGESRQGICGGLFLGFRFKCFDDAECPFGLVFSKRCRRPATLDLCSPSESYDDVNLQLRPGVRRINLGSACWQLFRSAVPIRDSQCSLFDACVVISHLRKCDFFFVPELSRRERQAGLGEGAQ